MPWFLIPKLKLAIPVVARSRHAKSLLVVIAIIALLYTIYWLIDNRGYQRGYNAMEEQHTEYIAKLRAEYEKKLTDQEIVRLDVESGMRDAIDLIHLNYQKQLEQVKNEAETAIAKHVDRTSRLSINTVPSTASTAADPNVAGSCAGNHGTTERRELAPEAAEFLIREAEYATELALRLKACQSTIITFQKKTAEYNERIE